MAVQQDKKNKPSSSFEMDMINLIRYIDQSAASDDKIRAQNRTIFIQTRFILLVAFSFLAVPLFVFYEYLFSFIPASVVDDLMWECHESTPLGYASCVAIFFITTADVLSTMDRNTHHILIVLCTVLFLSLTCAAISYSVYTPGMSSIQKRKMLLVRAVVTQRVRLTKHSHILKRISLDNVEGKRVQPMSTTDVLAVVELLNRIYQREQPELFKQEKKCGKMLQVPTQLDNTRVSLGQKMRRCAATCFGLLLQTVQRVWENEAYCKRALENSIKEKEE